MSFNITPVASGYQEIHLYSAMNVDGVKINTSLIMMKECVIHIVFAPLTQLFCEERAELRKERVELHAVTSRLLNQECKLQNTALQMHYGASAWAF